MRRVLRDLGLIRVRPRRRALIAVPVALGTVLTATGCTSGSADGAADTLSATPGPDADSAACSRLLENLPDTVLSRQRNTADLATGLASWGDPAIWLSCGATPTGPTTDECIEVDDVAWVFQETSQAFTFLTYGRDPAVLVTVPASVERTEVTGALVDLNDAVDQLDTTQRRCYDITDTAVSDAASTAATG